MDESAQTLWIEPLAPAKPAPGQPCNGCGVCCLSETCPLGLLLSARRQGPCRVLRWDAAERQYRCGALAAAPLLAPLVRRWIGAGIGCDCTLLPSETIPPITHPSHTP